MLNIEVVTAKVDVTTIKLGEHFLLMGMLFLRVPNPANADTHSNAIFAYKYGESGVSVIPTVFLPTQMVNTVSNLHITVAS